MGIAFRSSEFTERDTLLPHNEGRTRTLKLIFSVTCGVCVVGLLGYGLSNSTYKGPGSDSENSVLLGQSEGGGSGSGSSNRNNGRNNNNEPIVSTTAGRVRGIKLQSRKGREYNAFYAIPYAQPPTGELRFMAPQAIQRWNGVRNGTVKGPICVELKTSLSQELKDNTSEDCLYVNVFTPKLPSGGRRGGGGRRGRGGQDSSLFPVIAYLHGGAFNGGTANEYGPEYMMDEDIVLVMIESRVGALGYLNTGDGIIPGNMGLKDQVLALKWIQDNIDKFNGDNSNVALMGCSAGGIQTHGHLLSPMSKGLFAKAIIASGLSIIPGGMMFDFNPERTAQKFANKVNCTYQGSQELLDCLRNKTAAEIVKTQPQFGPSLEQNDEQAFFPDTPINMLMANEFQGSKVPTMFGINKHETLKQAAELILEENFINQVNQDFTSVMALLMNWELFEDQDEVRQDLTEIKDFYFGNGTSIGNETRWELTDLLGDRFYFHPTKLAALKHAEIGNDVYIYYFTRSGNYSFADNLKPIFGPPYGVSHADELQYLFNWEKFPFIPQDSEDFPFSEMFVKMHVGFLRTGVPEVKNNDWAKLDPATNAKVWYEVNNEPKMIEPFTQRMELWDSFDFQLLYNTTSDHLSTAYLAWGASMERLLEKW